LDRWAISILRWQASPGSRLVVSALIFYSSRLFDPQINSLPNRHGPNYRHSNSTAVGAEGADSSSTAAAEVELGRNNRTRHSHHRKRNLFHRNRPPTRRYRHQ
jgi:hypothetical protein